MRHTVPWGCNLRKTVAGTCLTAFVLTVALLHRVAERRLAWSKSQKLEATHARATHGSVPSTARGEMSEFQHGYKIEPLRLQNLAEKFVDMDGGAPLPLTAGRDGSLPSMPQAGIRPQRTEVLLHSGDGKALAPLYGLWSPAVAPRGVVIVVGGTSAGVAGPCRGVFRRVTSRSHGLYNSLAAALPASENVSVLQFSYRVSGWHGIAQSRKDMYAALHWVSGLSLRLPIGLVGHSMGAAVVLSPNFDALNEAGIKIAGVTTLAGVSKHIPRTISASIELLVLHDPADSNVPVAAAQEIYSRHSGEGVGHKRLRYARYNTTKNDPSEEALFPAAAHNFELGGACAKLVWPELLRWVRRWTAGQ